MAVHGDVTEVNYNHPTLGSGTFFPKANESNTFDPGGIRNNDDSSQITSSGDPIWQKNRVRGRFEIVVEDDQNLREDSYKASELAASDVPADWTVTLINGVVYQGTGMPVGDIQTDVNTGVFTLAVAVGNFEKIDG